MNHNIPAGEILPGSVVTQAFIGSDNHFSGVSLLLATYERRNDCHLDIKLFRVVREAIHPSEEHSELEQSVVCLERKIDIDAKQLYDNSDFEFLFDPLENSKGVRYVLSITSSA